MPQEIIRKIHERLYLCASARVWQDASGDWRYKTFGRCRLAIEGRTSALSLALAEVRRYG